MYCHNGLLHLRNNNITVCVQFPSNEEEWRQIAHDFEEKWQFPHCVGAIDGKHVAIIAPPNTGSLYYNYKHFYSIVLMAIVDAFSRFVYVDIGQYGRISDGGVFNNSSIGQLLASNSLPLPPADIVTGSESFIAPYTFVADDAFALKSNMLKPYSLKNLTPAQRIFNYRLSRARNKSENAIGIIAQRFRILEKPIHLDPEKASLITLTICCLHNFLMTGRMSRACYEDIDLTQNVPTPSGMQPITRQGSNRSSLDATNVREEFCKYFNSANGAVSWQWDKTGCEKL